MVISNIGQSRPPTNHWPNLKIDLIPVTAVAAIMYIHSVTCN
jgi:hypothetical protein